MNMRRRALVSFGAGIVGFAFVVASLSSVGEAQQQNTKKRDKAQEQDAQALNAAIGGVQAGQPAPSDVAIALERTDFFKSANGHTYVAFTATVDGKALPSPAVALMLRAVNKNAAAVPADADKKPGTTPAGDKASAGDPKARPASAVAYEDVDFIPLPPAEPGQPNRVSRAFQVAAGDYDLYVGLKERSTGDKKQKAKIAVLKHAFSVPDFHGTDLTTSSVVIAAKVAQLPKPLGADEQRANPYTIGILQVTPRIGSEFAKTEELNVYYQIYNEGLDAAGKPNVQIDYTFYRKQADGEKKIAASVPATLNATTLPQFDATKHQLADSPTWPLTTLQPGSYRLELKITDKISGKAVTKDVVFSVL